MSLLPLCEKVKELEDAGEPYCLVTLVDGRGSIPQEVGARAVFTRNGLAFGTVGGGRLEAKCQAEALALLAQNAPRHRFVRWNIQKDVGMTCGGEVALHFEIHGPHTQWQIVIFGAGHVSQELCRILTRLTCRITVFDTRADWLAKLPDHPKLFPQEVPDFAQGVADMPVNAYTLVMTKGHETDIPVLKAIHATNKAPVFLGMIGSDSKAAVVRNALRRSGLPEDFIARIICPVGEPFGDNTPPEIALSIAAQLLRHRSQRDALNDTGSEEGKGP